MHCDIRSENPYSKKEIIDLLKGPSSRLHVKILKKIPSASPTNLTKEVRRLAGLINESVYNRITVIIFGYRLNSVDFLKVHTNLIMPPKTKSQGIKLNGGGGGNQISYGKNPRPETKAKRKTHS